MSPPLSVFFTPSGKFDASSVSSTLTSGLSARARRPRVPLVDRRHERRRHALHDRVPGVVDVDARRQRRPVAGGEAAAAHELGEPRPRVVAEPGDVESEPRAAAGHVAFERLPLRRCVRHVVQPDHQPNVAEVRVVQVLPLGGGGERVAAVGGPGREGPHRLLREQDVIELAAGGEERQHPGTRRGRWLRGETPGDTSSHAMTPTIDDRISLQCRVASHSTVRRPPMRVSTAGVRLAIAAVVSICAPARRRRGRRHGRPEGRRRQHPQRQGVRGVPRPRRREDRHAAPPAPWSCSRPAPT